MGKESGHFREPSESMTQSTGYDRIYASSNGWSELWRGQNEGQFRVYKCLKPEFRGMPFYETLLHKEFQIGYGLDNKYISRFYSFSEIKGLGNCIEMEWVDGITLENALDNDAHLRNSQRRRLFLQLCEAMEYLHSHQIIHRDIKPSNILVTHECKDLKLIDFGVSDSEKHAIHKAAGGTLDFAAPELIADQEITHLCDIYSAGKILYLLFPQRFKHIAKKCTRTAPETRYSSATDLKKALMAYRIAAMVIPILLIIIASCLAAIYWPKTDIQTPEDAFDQATQTIENLNGLYF